MLLSLKSRHSLSRSAVCHAGVNGALSQSSDGPDRLKEVFLVDPKKAYRGYIPLGSLPQQVHVNWCPDICLEPFLMSRF